MRALKQAWRNMPEPVKSRVRAGRYWMLCQLVGEAVTVSVERDCFKVVHRNMEEYRCAKRFLQFEPEFLDLFLQVVANAEVVYDIGGYIGMYSLAAVCRNPRVAVYCFEPQATNSEAIRRNVSANQYDAIRVFATALGDTTASMPFVRRGQTGGFSPLGADSSASMIPQVTLDEFAEGESLLPPDIVKIDVEGYEANVLRGMQSILERYRPIVLVELHPGLLLRFGESEQAVDDWMAALRYRKQTLQRPGTHRRSAHSQVHAVYMPF